MDKPAPPKLRIRVHFDGAGMIGPGKAELLDRIGQTGSIAAAGRAMGMSYKRAWQLVETMNGMFEAPVVLRSRGGVRGGGATVTETGQQVLEAYRALDAAAGSASAGPAARLQRLLKQRAPQD